jgi:hypothetical protein
VNSSQKRPDDHGQQVETTAWEKSIIDSFILLRRQERYRSLLDTPTGRDKIRRAFPHFRDFDPRFVFPIPPGVQKFADIEHDLKKRGAPTECYVWSANSKWNGRKLNLRDALSNIVGWEPGTILVCIPGRLGYYEGEEKNERLILAK